MSAIAKAGGTPTRLKRSRASLVGGIATGIGVFVLTLLVAGDTSAATIAVGLAVASAVAIWVRLADL
jgi:hypothetical protein